MQERKFSSWSTRWTFLIEICRFLAFEIFLAISPRFCRRDFLFAVTAVFNFCRSRWLGCAADLIVFAENFLIRWLQKTVELLCDDILSLLQLLHHCDRVFGCNYSTFLRIGKLFGKTHMRQRKKLGFLVNLFWGHHNTFY